MSRPDAFPVFEVPLHIRPQDEPLGTKPKFWFTAGATGHKHLFKATRPNEDWSEKVAAELANLLGLPHARYSLARHGDQVGVVTPSFVGEGEMLVHGNDLLSARNPDYPRDDFRGVRVYTVEACLEAVRDVEAEVGPQRRAAEQLLGYLLLDAWIGNTDRHHENWGIVHGSGEPRLAPTFDHATCLGRELTVENAELRLTTRDERQTVDFYLGRCRSAFYAPDSLPDSRPMHPHAAWRRAAACEPEAAAWWLRILARIDRRDVLTCVERIPDDRISAPHRRLATRILETNYERIRDDA